MGATKGTIKERLELTIRNLQAAGYEGRLERDALAEIERLERMRSQSEPGEHQVVLDALGEC